MHSRTLSLIVGCTASIFTLQTVRAADAGMATPNPQMQEVLDTLKSLNPKPIQDCTAAQARSQPGPADAVMALMKKKGLSTDPMPVGKVDDVKIQGDGGNIPVRVYTPKGDGPFPVLLYFHGGGFVLGTLDTYDASCRELCDGAGCIVASVGYRLAPEYKFPAAPDDAWAAWKWISENAKSINGDPARIAVGGESAGGNLATETALTAAEKGGSQPIYELLIYPVTGNKLDTHSYEVNAEAKPLNKAMMRWFFDMYLPTPASAEDPRVMPMLAKTEYVEKLPPTMVITDQIDPLQDDGKMYADKLTKHGVKVEYKNYDSVTHEFFGMGAVVDEAKQAETDAIASLKMAFMK